MKKTTTPIPLFSEHLRALCASVMLGFVFFAPYFVSAAEDGWVKGSLVRQTGGGALHQFTKAGAEFKPKAAALSDDGSKIVLYTNTTAFEPGYFVSTNGGATWADRTYASGASLNGGFRFGSVSGDGSRFFAIEPVYQYIGGVVHTGYALKVSFDNGATWGGLTFPVAGGDNARYASNRCFDDACRAKKMSMDEWGPIYAISRDGGKLLYIANWSGDDSCSGACQSIWISNNGGNSWFKSKEWKGGSSRKALSMTIPPAYSDDTNTIMLVGSSDGMASESSRLFFSRDGGVSWNERDFGESISAVSAPGSGASMIVTLYKQVYKSTDGGTSWFLDATVPADTPYIERVTGGIKASAGNGSVLLADIAGRLNFLSGSIDFDGPTRMPLSFDQGKTWTKKVLPSQQEGFSFDAVVGVSRTGNTVLVTSEAHVFVSSATPDTTASLSWTQYCTGGSDPNGNNWQWWEKSSTNPVQYRFVRIGDGVCSAPLTVPTVATPVTTTNAIGRIEVTPDGVCETQGVDGYAAPVCPVKVVWSSSAKQTMLKVRYIGASAPASVPERTLFVSPSTEASGSLTVKIPLGDSVFDLYDASVSPNQKIAGHIQRGIQWTLYCTGGDDPNGNRWQWWAKSNTNPAQYRFSSNGSGTCTPQKQTVAPQVAAPVPVPTASVAEVTGTISATSCAAAANSTCEVSVTWTSTNSKNNWIQVNIVKPDGTTIDSYKVQRAGGSHAFKLSSGLYAIALIGFQQNDSPSILKSTNVTVGVAAAATPVPTPSSMPTTNKIPFGYLDSATCTEIKGWAYDSDNQNATVALHIYEGSTFVTSGNANVARTDVNRVMGIVGDHGFIIPLPATLKDGKAHTLTVYALDTAGGKSATLQQSPRTVTCTAAIAPVSLVAVAIIPFTVAVDMLSDVFFALGI